MTPCSYLNVFVNVQCEPVQGVKDEAHAHVGSGVVEVAQQIHSLLALFGPEQSVNLLGAPHLVGG